LRDHYVPRTRWLVGKKGITFDRVEHWPIEQLILYANNPRLHSEADLEKIAASIPRGGFSFSSCSHSQLPKRFRRYLGEQPDL